MIAQSTRDGFVTYSSSANFVERAIDGCFDAGRAEVFKIGNDFLS